MGITGYGSFIISAILLNMTPGVDTIYVLSRSAADGRKKGVLSALGISTGILIHTALASLGLTVILAKSAIAFSVVKYIGAAYLTVMGVKTLLTKKSLMETDTEKKDESAIKVYLQGMLTNVLNPKAALFFMALLPQFVAADNRYGAIPFLLLGVTFCTTSTIWSLFLAFAASSVSKLLHTNKKLSTVTTKLSGVIYIALGLKILSAEAS